MGEERDPRTHAIIGAAMEVHSELGPGFLEPIYQESFEYELQDRQIPYRREPELPVRYKKRTLAKTYQPDFACYDEIIVELKALEKLSSREEAQIINYLKASKMKVGLLINFGGPKLEFKRFVY